MVTTTIRLYENLWSQNQEAVEVATESSFDAGTAIMTGLTSLVHYCAVRAIASLSHLDEANSSNAALLAAGGAAIIWSHLSLIPLDPSTTSSQEARMAHIIRLVNLVPGSLWQQQRPETQPSVMTLTLGMLSRIF